jgi:hypothetical protein
MSITTRAAKALEPETTTEPESPSAPGIIHNAMLYRAHLRGSISGEFELGKLPKPTDANGSIWAQKVKREPSEEEDGSSWGWVRRHKFDPHFGYYLEDE